MSSEKQYRLELPCSEEYDLEKTMKLGPFLFFYTSQPSRGLMISQKKVMAEFSQDGSGIIVDLVSDNTLTQHELAFLRSRLSFCLGCEENLSEFYSIAESDAVLSRYFDRIFGTRMLSAFDEFEALACIICSQNTSLANYRRSVRNLVEIYGEGSFFPTPEAVLNAPEMLEATGVGYRAEFLTELARYFSRHGRFHVPQEVELMRIKGIGRYSAQIYYLLQLRDYGRIYFDRLMASILSRHYGFVFQKEAEARRYLKRLFDGYAGLAELYLQIFLNPFSKRDIS